MTKREIKQTNNALLFARVSTRDQEDGYSREEQLFRMRKYCKEQGLTVINEMSIVESSTKGERKNFYKMIKYVKEQKGSVAIICDKIDRLQRGFKELPLLDELRISGKISLHFYVERQIYDKKSSSHDLMAYRFHIMMAENYVNSVAENVRHAFEGIRRAGKVMGEAPVGYKISVLTMKTVTLLSTLFRALL